jgi:hypothetical protein
MTNGSALAEFWKGFVVDRCDYPAPDRLREQLREAHFFDFCGCGCNSFAVRATPGARPLVSRSENCSPGHVCFFTADFRTLDERSLEIALFAGGDGSLEYIEVTSCANSYPITAAMNMDEKPFQTWASEQLVSD